MPASTLLAGASKSAGRYSIGEAGVSSSKGLGVGAILGMFIGSCVGEGEVSFNGTVTESDEAGHSFDAALDPAGLPAIEGATVVVFVDTGSCGDPGKPVNADGVFDDNVMYGGATCASSVAVVCAKAPGYETVRLEFDTADRTRTDGQKFLNIRLRRDPKTP